MTSNIICMLDSTLKALKEDIIWKQWSTLKENLIANTISGHLYESDSILFNKVLISAEKLFER